jgi:predicted transposase YbfD/YdcC
VVTASGAGARRAIGPSAVPEGGNGITAARALLETLSLDGGVGDRRCGLHTQSDTAQVILERGGDYLFALKGNHPLLMREVAEYFASPPEKLAKFQTVDADPGRIGTGVHRLSHEADWLFPDRRYKDEPRLPGLAMIACVQSSRQTGESLTTATRCHVSSTRLTPDAVATALPAHWSVENRLHRVLTTSFDEDRARTRTDNSPENVCSAFCDSPPSPSCERPAPNAPSPETANTPDGPMTSQDPSSAKCDSPGGSLPALALRAGSAKPVPSAWNPWNEHRDRPVAA